MTSCALPFPVAAPAVVTVTRRGPVCGPPLTARWDDILNPVDFTESEISTVIVLDVSVIA